MITTAYRGVLLPKLYWIYPYDSYWGVFSIIPIKRLFKIGKLYLYLSSYYRRYFYQYSKKALNHLSKYFNVGIEVIPKDYRTRKRLSYPQNISYSEILRKSKDSFITTSCYSKEDGSYVGQPQSALIYLKEAIK